MEYKEIIYLKNLFCKDESDSHCLIKASYDAGVTYFEEYNPGVIETDIIPIKYDGVLSKQIALYIKELFTTQSERYKFFLQNFEEIVISNDIDSYNDTSLILDGYNKIDNFSNWNLLGFFISKFESASEELLNGLDIYCEELLEATYPIRTFYASKKDIEEDILYYYTQVIAFCLDNNYLEQLEILLNGNQDTEDLLKVMASIKKMNQYTWLNKLLSDEVNPFFKNHFELFSEALKYLENYRESNYQEFINFYQITNKFQNCNFIFDDSITLSKEQEIIILQKFFESVDKTHELLNFFNSHIEDNSIILLGEDDVLPNNLPSNLDIINGPYFSPYDKYVFVPLSNTIYDLFLISHEVIHYYFDYYSDLNHKKDIFDDTDLLEEFPSIYIEKALEEFLVQNGFDEKVIRDFYNQRVLFTAGNNYLMVASLAKLFEVKSIYETIDEENIGLCDDELQVIKELGKAIEIDKVWNNPNCLKDYGDRCDGAINNVLDFQTKALGYILGVYFTSSLEIDAETSEFILNYKNTKGQKDYDDIITIETEDYINKKQNNKVLKKEQ